MAPFVRKWQTKSTKTWLRRMYRNRRLWAASYLASGHWLGMKSNQRSESLNSCLHLHLDGEMTLVDMAVHFEVAIVRIRENEARDDCTDSQTSPVPVTSSKELEIAAAKVFTAENFYMLQDELKKISGIEILERNIGAESVTFLVAWRHNHKSKFYVEYRPTNLDDVISCSCKRMVRKGLPCKHILDTEWQLSSLVTPSGRLDVDSSKFPSVKIPRFVSSRTQEIQVGGKVNNGD